MSEGRWRAKFKRVPKRLIKVYVAAFICFFSCSFSVTVLFPFLPFMVEHLLPWLTENEELVATYVGYLVSVPYLGRVCGSYIWGVIADHKGRKPVIIISVLLIGLSSAAFGFSVSFEMALVLRFLAGLLTGAPGVCKAVVSEVSDNSNQAFGVAMLGTSWGLGVILGPAVSGAISDPIGQYNLTIEHTATREFLMQFPYSLPCLLSALLSAVSALLCLILLPETLGVKKNQKQSETFISQSTSRDTETDNLGTSPDTRLAADLTMSQPELDNHTINAEPETQDGQTTVECSQHEGSTVPNDLVGLAESDTTQLLAGENQRCERRDEVIHRSKLSKCGLKVLHWVKDAIKNLITLLRDKPTLLSVLVFSVFSAIDIGFNEIYSVWAKTSPHLGGLGFSLSEIGITLTVSTLLLIPIGLIIFPLLERKLGLLRVYYMQSVILIPAIMLLPNVHYVYEIKWLLWILVCSVTLTIQVCFNIAYNCQVMFMNNSVTFDKLGAVNGIGYTFTSLIRAIASLVSGQIFSLSLQATAAGLGYPLDYRLLFLVFGTVISMCVLLTACLPVSINKQNIPS